MIKLGVVLLVLVTVTQCQYIQSNYTQIDSILNEASYYSIDTTYGSSEKQRVENRLNEIREQFQQTKGVLQNIEVLSSNENYSVFINNNSKEVYLVIRGTVPTKISDLQNDAEMFFQQTPQRVQQINELMKGQMTDLFNEGYSINVSGHSLGGSLTLFTCADNSWVNHCEVHNPYLDDTIINKLNPIFNKNEMNDKIVVQETLNDKVSQFFPSLHLNVTYSIFDLSQIENVQGLGNHSALGLFAKAFLEGNQTISFNNPDYSVDEFYNFVNLCKSKFEEYINQVSQCKNNQYYNLSTLACLACPFSQSCRDNILGPYNCPPSKIATDSGECQSCQAGSYVSEVGKNICFKCPVGHKCTNGVKIPCSPGQKNEDMGSDVCYPCRSGTYQTSSGATSCILCPYGYQCPSKTEEPIPCTPGTYQDYQGNISCNECKKGTYQTSSGSTACKQCPYGNQCPSKTEEPIPCAPGTYQAYQYGISCDECEKGTYQTQSGSTTCIQCPYGNQCPSKTEKPIPCAPGTYQAYQYGISCDECEKGTYQTSSGAVNCLSCPQGYKCPSTTQPPILCPSGTYQEYTNRDSCDICPTGYMSNDNRTDCIKNKPSLRQLILRSAEKQKQNTDQYE